MPSASRIRGRLDHFLVLLVPYRVQGQDFEFLVDTGAAYTALSKDVVAFLGMMIHPQRTTIIAPAHGAMIQVPLITIAELSLGGFRLAHVDAIAVEFSRALKLDGLLGMNVLGRFRTTIEIDTRTLVLRPL